MKNFFIPVAAAGMIAGGAPEAKASAPKPETTADMVKALDKLAQEVPGQAMEAGKKLGMVEEAPIVAKQESPKKKLAVRKKIQKAKDTAAQEDVTRRIAQM